MKEKHIKFGNSVEKLPLSTMKDELMKGLMQKSEDPNLDDDLSHL